MFKIHSEYTPAGDQPKAIKKLVEGLNNGEKFQTLLGVTGSRENFYYGKCNRAGAKTHPYFSTQ